MSEAVASRTASNRTTLVACCALVVVMVGAAYAAVPLYRLFCQLTGFGGTTQVATTAPASALAQMISVRFDSNVAPGLNWSFKAETPVTKLRIGETSTIFYKITNHSSEPVTAQATYNVQPDLAGSYFNKLQCFCFTDLTLKPGETLDVPVVFFVDPALASDKDISNLDTITLSYTFFPSKARKTPVAELTEPPKPQL
ncbi:MAG: cytochrome c oxidase assembly protein [Alphaproteobacteria bacterium]